MNARTPLPLLLLLPALVLPRAAAAWDSGIYDDEVMRFPVLPYDRVVARDTIDESGSVIEAYRNIKAKGHVDRVKADLLG